MDNSRSLPDDSQSVIRKNPFHLLNIFICFFFLCISTLQDPSMLLTHASWLSSYLDPHAILGAAEHYTYTTWAVCSMLGFPGKGKSIVQIIRELHKFLQVGSWLGSHCNDWQPEPVTHSVVILDKYLEAQVYGCRQHIEKLHMYVIPYVYTHIQTLLSISE